jgi:hypothetical protein
MLASIHIGAVVVALGLAIHLPLGSKRWVRDVLQGQNRLPKFVRCDRREKSVNDVRRGLMAASYVTIEFGLFSLTWASYVGIVRP